MKILFITNKIPYPPNDGGAIATLSLIRGLSELGHDVVVWSLNTSKHHVELDSIPKHLTKDISWNAYNINTDIRVSELISNYLFSGKPYIARRFYSHEAVESLESVLKADQFDIVQIEGLYMLQYIPVIRRVLGSRILVSFRAHNIEHEIWQRRLNLEKNIFKKHYISVLSRRIRTFKSVYLNQYDLLIPITERDADFFLKFGNIKPVKVIPVGIETETKSEYKHEKEDDIFFLGALDWAPNLEGLHWFVEKVFPLLRNEMKTLSFHVAGRNASMALIDLLKKEQIVFHGEVPDATKFMLDHGVMIVPLFSGSGMRVKIVEGMSLGKAIVSTTIGAEGIPYTIGEEIVIADNVETMVEKIRYLLLNQEKVREMGEKARNFATRHFDNQQLCMQLSEFYIQYVSH